MAMAFAAAAPATLAETPKTGGSLTYMIPADAPPSLDGHRETTYATVHSAAPFYSMLIRVDPNTPSSTSDFVCDQLLHETDYLNQDLAADLLDK